MLSAITYTFQRFANADKKATPKIQSIPHHHADQDRVNHNRVNQDRRKDRCLSSFSGRPCSTTAVDGDIVYKENPASTPAMATPDANLDNNVRCGLLSVTGNYRQINEDRCYANVRQRMFLVADGMGGHQGGAEAGQIIVDVVPANLANDLQQADPSLMEVQDAVRRAVEAARDRMIDFAAARFGYEKMGATVALGLLAGDRMYVSHVGDSRAYHFRRGRIKQLTQDQTYVQALIESRTITPEQAKTHPMRNVVLNSVSVSDLESPPEVSIVKTKPGDRFLFCTDGLTGVVDQQSLENVLRSQDDVQGAADELVHLALNLDSKDNVTCVVVEII